MNPPNWPRGVNETGKFERSRERLYIGLSAP
jgi:hypothetical protein